VNGIHAEDGCRLGCDASQKFTDVSEVFLAACIIRAMSD
jgi:hypothetical protein